MEKLKGRKRKKSYIKLVFRIRSPQGGDMESLMLLKSVPGGSLSTKDKEIHS